MRSGSVVGLLLLVLGGGCGGAVDPLAEVEGQVLFQGEPLQGGTIVFAPDPTRGGRGPLARAVIGADGRFQLHTEEKAGAVVGWHRVTVAATGIPAETWPRHLCDPEQSGLAREVKVGTNTIELRIE